MKALVLLSEQPYPPFGGSKVRNYFLWPKVSELGVDLKILGLSARKQDWAYSFPTRFFPFKKESNLRRIWGICNYSYHQWPTSELLHRAVAEEVETWKPDIVHAEELRMASYIPKDFNRKSCTFHNVESELLKKTGSTRIPIFGNLFEPLHIMNLKKLEREVIDSFHWKFAYSEVDKTKYEGLFGRKNWNTTSGGVAIHNESWKDQSSENTVLLTGSFSYAPNIEGALWFFSEVYPAIRGAIRMIAAGSGASPELRRLFSENEVEFLDSPLNLEEIYRRSALSIVPLLSGSGTRGRILESIGNGRVCITTTIGAEGLDLKEEEGVIIQDSAEGFAKAILRLVGDKGKRLKISERGIVAIEKYSWENVAKHLVHLWKAGS